VARRARADGAATGADGRKIGQRQAGIVEFTHPHRGVHIGGTDRLAPFQPLVKPDHRRLRCLNPVGIAADGDAVATA